jgi:hypothetical protein
LCKETYNAWKRFDKWLADLTETETKSLENLEKKCRYSRELIQFELNNIYEQWYGTKTPKSELSSDTRKYLREYHNK